MIRDLKLLWRIKGTRKHLRNTEPAFLHPLGLAPACVDRVAHLLALSLGKRVLHFGFLDLPFLEAKLVSGELLHTHLKKVARFLYGVDIDPGELEIYRSISGDRENSVLDIQNEGVDLSGLARNFDVILFPEVLEHLQNPGTALLNLHRLCRANGGSVLCVTVPNAFSLEGFVSALDGTEIVHPEHYYYFSPYTLRKLLTDCGYKKVALSYYASSHNMDSPGLTKNGLIALCEA